MTDALARLISYNHCTSEFSQYSDEVNTAQHCRLGLFQDSDFARGSGRLTDRPREKFYVSSGVKRSFP